MCNILQWFLSLVRRLITFFHPKLHSDCPQGSSLFPLVFSWHFPASVSPILLALPNPISLGFPRHVNLSTHLREPVSETTKYRLPPSLYLPGLAVSILRAVSLLEM
jgi:hypothetical protein